MADLCLIKGIWADSQGTPRAAQIEVTLDAPILDDSTSPDTIIFPSPVQINVASDGVIEFSLPPSEASQTAYLFKITPATVNSLQARPSGS